MNIEHHWPFVWESDVDGSIHGVSSFLFQYLHLAYPGRSEPRLNFLAALHRYGKSLVVSHMVDLVTNEIHLHRAV